MFLGILTPLRLVLAGILIVTVIATHWKAYVMGTKSVKAEWDRAKVEQLEEDKKLLQMSIKDSKMLQDKSNQIQQEKYEKLKKNNATLSTNLDQLRTRQGRDEAITSDSSPIKSGRGCTGADLHREDAEFLVREASAADEVKINLQECQIKYNSIRNTINKAVN